MLVNTYLGGLAGLAATEGVQRLLGAIPGVPEKIEEIKDDITRFQRKHFGHEEDIYPDTTVEGYFCEGVRNNPHPNKDYQAYLEKRNCGPQIKPENESVAM